MTNHLRALLPLAPLALAVAACGSGSTPTTTPTSVTSVTTAKTLSPAHFTGPVLDITQLGFRMTFPAQLGTVNYTIDRTGAGAQTDGNGTPYRFVATVVLFTSAYAADCAATTTTTTTSSTGASPAQPLATPSVPVAEQNPQEAQILVFDHTSATSLNLGAGGVPDFWTRAGSLLLGFRQLQTFVACGNKQLLLDLPLLEQMFSTARAD